MHREIVILGSTGSIGTQTLDVVRHNQDIKVAGLAAYSNIDLLEKQIKEFPPDVVCVMQEDKGMALQARLKAQGISTEVIVGSKGLSQLAVHPAADTVVTAVVGMVGLLPTLAAIEAGKTMAVANKETQIGRASGRERGYGLV